MNLRITADGLSHTCRLGLLSFHSRCLADSLSINLRQVCHESIRAALGFLTSLVMGMSTPYVAKRTEMDLLTPNDDCSGRTAPLTSKRCILYIYSTHIGTEYFKHGIYSRLFPLQSAVCFIILTYLVPVLFTVHIQGALKLKK